MANLITKAEYKLYAGISSTNHDAEIDSLIPKVTALVESYCRRKFTYHVDEPKVEVFSGGTDVFYLKEAPVLNVLSVENSQDFGKNYTELAEFDYWVLDENAIRYTGRSEGFDNFPKAVWPKFIRGYRVTYTAGFEEIPQDLKLAVMDLVKYYSRNDGAVHSNRAPTGTGIQVEYITNTQLPAHIKRVLDQYVVDYT